MGSIYRELLLPEDTASASVKEHEAEFLYGLVKEQGLRRSLETGFANGASAVHILSAQQGLKGARHIVIDPFQERYADVGLKNVRRLGLSRGMRFEPHYSHEVLPRLQREGERIDFAFIDGGHRFDEAFVDFYYIDLMLVHGGFVVIHDVKLRPVATLASWIRRDKSNYRRVGNVPRNMLMVQKTGPDTRPWWHYRSFGTMKGLLTHSLHVWRSRTRLSTTRRDNPEA